MTIKLEVGKKYRNRRGEVITIKRFDCDGVRFVYQGDDFFFYDQEGICAFSALPRLIEEVIEEPVKKPHKWAKEIHAMADGIEVEWLNAVTGKWQKPNRVMNPISDPQVNWRIKRPQWQHDLIDAAKAGKPVQIYVSGGWYTTMWGNSVKEHFNHPSEYTQEQYRIKPQEVPQWRKDLAQAIEDGKVVEFNDCGVWINTANTIESFLNQELLFDSAEHYRIKPAPKPDVTYCFYLNDSNELQECYPHHANIKIIRDGTTRKLKSAEVLK